MKILRNAIRTPDGTVLESFHRHDFKTYEDSITKKTYGVDGGLDYLKRIGDTQDCEELVINTDNYDHEEAISILKWGKNYDKDMNRLPKTEYSYIKDMETSHIENIINGDYVKKNSIYYEVFKEELRRRNLKDE